MKIPKLPVLECEKATCEKLTISIGGLAEMFPVFAFTQKTRPVRLRKYELPHRTGVEAVNRGTQRLIVLPRECQYLMNKAKVMLRQNVKTRLCVCMHPTN